MLQLRYQNLEFYFFAIASNFNASTNVQHSIFFYLSVSTFTRAAPVNSNVK